MPAYYGFREVSLLLDAIFAVVVILVGVLVAVSVK